MGKKNNVFEADVEKSLTSVLKILKVMMGIIFIVSPLIIIFTPGNKILVGGVLVLLEFVLIYRIHSFGKDRGSEPIVEDLMFNGFDVSGKHSFARQNGKKVKIIYIPLELQNAFEDEGVYQIHYLEKSKIFAKAVGGSNSKKMQKKK